MKLEHVSCDLCGSEDYTVRYRKPDDWLWLNLFEYPVVECCACGLVYVNPRPPFDEMARFYPPGYHHNRDDAAHLQRYQHQFGYINKKQAVAVLDIGCASGDWLNYIGSQWPAAELHGVDAFSEGVSGSAIHFHKNQLPDAQLPAAYFDLITSWAVFEHVHTPDAYFSVVAKVLKPGGRFVFLVTNSESFYGKYSGKEDIPRHLYHFNERSLKQYAQKHGLHLESVAYDERFWDGTGSGTFKRMMARLCGLQWRNVYKKTANPLQKILMLIGGWLDRVVFCYPWEARLKRSGIIIVTMTKGE